MQGLKDFLESSTIHGLAHISTSGKKLQKLLWMFIVLSCFILAGCLIYNSFSDWDRSPVSTTIETHPITDVPFPRSDLLIIFRVYQKYETLRTNLFPLNCPSRDQPHIKVLRERAVLLILSEGMFWKFIYSYPKWYCLSHSTFKTI